MISPTSRYADNAVQPISDGDTVRMTIIPAEPVAKTYNFSYYQMDATDTVDQLAYSFYGDGTLWWRIADANPEILDWFNVPAGTVLRIPSA